MYKTKCLDIYNNKNIYIKCDDVYRRAGYVKNGKIIDINNKKNFLNPTQFIRQYIKINPRGWVKCFIRHGDNQYYSLSHFYTDIYLKELWDSPGRFEWLEAYLASDAIMENEVALCEIRQLMEKHNIHGGGGVDDVQDPKYEYLICLRTVLHGNNTNRFIFMFDLYTCVNAWVNIYHEIQNNLREGSLDCNSNSIERVYI